MLLTDFWEATRKYLRVYLFVEGWESRVPCRGSRVICFTKWQVFFSEFQIFSFKFFMTRLWKTTTLKTSFLASFLYLFLCFCTGFRSCYYQSRSQSWSPGFIVFQCYWRTAMRNIPCRLVSNMNEYSTWTIGDGSFWNKFSSLAFSHLAFITLTNQSSMPVWLASQ